MTTAQVVETSVTNKSLSKDYPHPEDHDKPIADTPGFKPFAISNECRFIRTMDWLCCWSMFQDKTFQWSRKSQVFYIAVTEMQQIFVNTEVLFTRSAYRFLNTQKSAILDFSRSSESSRGDRG